MTGGNFDHFLITRFNVDIEGWPSPSEEWLRDRWQLFSTFCLPSVRAQSQTNFRWLVLVGRSTPDWLMELLTAERRLEAVVMQNGWSPQRVAELIRSRRSHDCVITSRLDNDDAIWSGFIDRVQTSVQGRDCFLNFTFGYQWLDGRVFWKPDSSNAFISRVEYGLDPESVFIDQHPLLNRYGPVVQIRTRPAWLQNVHASNIANRISGVRVRGVGLSTRFLVEAEPRVLPAIAMPVVAVASGARVAALGLRSPSKLLRALWTKRLS